jgi:PAS domain S-box-containing protein
MAGIAAGKLVTDVDLRKELERTLLSGYVRVGLVVDATLTVLEILGLATPYFTLPSAKESFKLLKLLPDAKLFREIEKLAREVQRSGEAARRDHIQYGVVGEADVEVIPLGTTRTRSLLVLLGPASRLNVPQRLPSNRTTVPDALLENEELGRLNNKLKTAKEELHSTNEELTRLKQELLSNNAALAEERHFAKLILETAVDPLLVLDNELRVKTANASFYRMFCISPRQAEGQLLYSVLDGCWDTPRLREMLEKILPDTKAVLGFEIDEEFPGIGRKVLALNARQFDGSREIVLGIEDVTDRKERADANLREIEERFRSMADTAPVMIWVSDPHKLYTFFNKVWLELTGRTLDQERGYGWTESVHPHDLDRCLEIYASSFDARRTFQMEYRLRRADGEYRWLLNNGVPRFEPGDVFAGYIGSCVDITELKRAEAALRESEERFRSMADTAPVMIWVSDLHKLCTFFNKVWLEFTGRTLEQELGHNWAENVHPQDLDRCLEIYSSSFDARRTFQMEYRLRRADGEYRWLLDNGIPRFEPGGVFVGYIGSCVDITDLKRTHEEHLAKQKLETVGTLAGGIAHDFNNLLGGVLAHSELAMAELPNGSDPTEELKRIRDAAIRGAEIVRQLMVYAGEETEVLEFAGISAIVEDMLELLKVSVSKHVAVETDLSKHLRPVRANPSKIRQVVMNLFTNASEAIGDVDGVIRVTTRSVTVGRESPVEIWEPLAEGDYVQLEVSDTGRGMTREVQDRVFDMFFTTKVAGSHGLGLAVVQGIVQSLHGTIRLSSAPGEGSTFQIMFPCEESMVEVTHSPIVIAEGKSLASLGATILVVEDEELLREGVSKMLRKKGLTVLEAGDGSAALAVLRAQNDHIDVLLLDITLPGASSREIYEEAKRLRPDLPVIITSANSEEVSAASLSMKIGHFLRKPFRLGDLNDMIRQILLT